MPLPPAARRSIVAVTTAATTGGLVYLYFNRPQPTPPTFDLPVKHRAADGTVQVQTRQFNLLSSAEVDSRIRKHAASKSVPSANGGLIWKHDTAFLNSNDPIEDAHANLALSRPLIPGGPSPPEHDSDLLMFGIFDGHGGPWTSRLLSKTLIPAVALELATLNENKPDSSSKGAWSYLKSWIPFSGTTTQASKTFDADPTYVKLAIQTAFANLDSSIINTPIQILQQLAKDPSISAKDHPMAYASMLPALSGSCALFALVDTARRDLFVACTGDSRAVAGYWDEDANGSGKWRVEVLSEDQTGRNPNELLR